MKERIGGSLPDEPGVTCDPPEGGAGPTIRLSLVIPTAGRESLWRTLMSISPQVGPGDDVIVVREPGDCRSGPAFDRSGLRGACVADTTPGPTRWGYKARAFL